MKEKSAVFTQEQLSILEGKDVNLYRVVQDAEIETVFTINNLAHIFLRDDLKHADIQIVSDDGTGSINATTNPTTITKTTIDGSTHSYYTAPPNATNYQVSTAKYNTGGSSLIETSSDISIQFNDFKLLIDNFISNSISSPILISPLFSFSVINVSITL